VLIAMQPARNPVDELQVQLQMSQMLSHARNQLDHGQPNDALQVRPPPPPPPPTASLSAATTANLPPTHEQTVLHMLSALRMPDEVSAAANRCAACAPLLPAVCCTPWQPGGAQPAWIRCRVRVAITDEPSSSDALLSSLLGRMSLEAAHNAAAQRAQHDGNEAAPMDEGGGPGSAGGGRRPAELLAAAAAGESYVCGRCNSLLSRSRREAHELWWCEGGPG
jgi:hypothetical protein